MKIGEKLAEELEKKVSVALDEKNMLHVHKLFGINKKRYTEIIEAMKKIYNNTDKFHELLIESIRLAKNEKELSAICLNAGRLYEHEKSVVKILQIEVDKAEKIKEILKELITEGGKNGGYN